MHKFVIALISLFLFNSNTLAQDVNSDEIISGKIVDNENNPLINATVAA